MKSFITRREFISICALAAAGYPISKVFASDQKGIAGSYPLTVEVLKEAYVAELSAHEHYNGYCQKAIEENYPNLAYFFAAFSVSEKVHAENYKRILIGLGADAGTPKISTLILDTKGNVQAASSKELKKISDIYPEFIKRLQPESHEEAVVSCIYSLKSHQQHNVAISDMDKYSRFFFSIVAREIEGMEVDFHVCDVCGSTILEAPQGLCEICNLPLEHYQRIKRPAV